VRQEKLNRVKIVEKEKDSLEVLALLMPSCVPTRKRSGIRHRIMQGPMKEAQEYITKEYELSVQQAALFQVHEMEHTEKLQVLEAKKEEVQQQFEEIKKSLGTLSIAHQSLSHEFLIQCCLLQRRKMTR